MNYSIHKPTLNELSEIVGIVKTSLKEDFPMYDIKIQTAYGKIFGKKFFRKLLTEKGNTVLGAYVNNDLVGILGIKGDFGGAAFVEWFIVKKEFRNQGIGKTLLKACEKWVFDNKYHFLYLFTESHKNIKFYKRRGFEYVGKYRKSWFGADEHVMQKLLREKPFEEIFEKYLRK